MNNVMITVAIIKAAKCANAVDDDDYGGGGGDDDDDENTLKS